MLSMNVRIFQNGSSWTLEVSCPVGKGTKAYFFSKTEFINSQAAKLFFYENIGLFVVHMGSA